MREFTSRVLKPFALPMAALGVIAVLVFGTSRILLAVTEAWSVAVALALAATIVFYAATLGAVRQVTSTQRSLALVLAIAVMGAGGWGLGKGVREIEKHLAGIPLTAANIAWEETTLEAPAETAFAVEVINNDAGVPHNLGIYRQPDFTDPVVQSELFNGVGTQLVEVEALPAGEYVYRCDVHPEQMKGVLTVAEGVEIGGGSGGGHA